MTTSPDLPAILRSLTAGEPMTSGTAEAVFQAVMAGKVSDAQIAAVLTAIAMRPGGVAVEELAGAARAMRQVARPVPTPPGVEVVDTCGTGGDHSGTFNVSTAAALVAAGAGATIAKHGNRSVTSRSGSSQVLEALGVKLAVSDETLQRCLAEARICFCFAPAHHPAMKHVVPVRQQLGFRTIFNLLGPLTNPAGARRQVIGVWSEPLTELIANVLAALGATHAMVVHGMTPGHPDGTHGGSGLDEITTTGPTRIATVHNGAVGVSIISPEKLGLPRASLADLAAADIEDSARIIREVLDGKPGAPRDIVSLNAAAALVVADIADDLKHGLELTQMSLDSGAARQTLDKLVEITQAG